MEYGENFQMITKQNICVVTNSYIYFQLLKLSKTSYIRIIFGKRNQNIGTFFNDIKECCARDDEILFSK